MAFAATSSAAEWRNIEVDDSGLLITFDAAANRILGELYEDTQCDSNIVLIRTVFSALAALYRPRRC
jgi:hypothetical protein